jgi:hypothetical protein
VNIRTNRRTFVRGMAAMGVAAPFLRMLENPARAQTPIKRLVLYITPLGIDPDSWVKEDRTWGLSLQDLVPLKDKLTVMRGLDNRAGGLAPLDDHRTDFPSLLTGRHPAMQNVPIIQGPSLDTVIGRYLYDKMPAGQKTKYPYYHFGSRTKINWPLFASAAGNPIGPVNDPMRVYSDMFAGLGAGQITPGKPPVIDPALERIIQTRRSILDLVKSELTAIRCNFGADEKYKFDAHMAAIRDVENGLSVGAGSGAVPACGKPTLGTGSDFPSQIKSQMDNVVAALSCDILRVAAIQLETNSSALSHSAWLPDVPDTGHHAIAHGNVAGKNGLLGRIDGWYAKHYAYLIDKLNKIPEGGGTMLDNTAVVWLHEQGRGTSHMRYDHGMVVAGLKSYFKPGQTVDFRTGELIKSLNGNGTATNSYPLGQPHVRLLMSIADAMGVPFDPRNPFNDSKMPAVEKEFFSQGPLAELHV